MTTIYDRLNATGYEFVNTVSEDTEDYRTLCNLCGPSRKHNWKPILVESHRASRRTGFKVADIPYTHGAFFVRPSAIAVLQDVLEAHGELLPLATVDGSEMYVFNPRFVLDALDMERSELEYASPTSRFGVRKYVFIESVVRDVDIFRLPQAYLNSFFSDRFVERVKKAKLKGTDFIKLWSSAD